MVTKREIATAQARLIEAAHDVVHADVVGVVQSARDTLRRLEAAYDEWDRLRLTLEGEGAAVARSTSIAAAHEHLMLKQSVRRDILVMVVAHHNHYGVGMTSDAIMARLHGKHQTVSARVSELVNRYQLLRDSGRKYATSSGSKAIAWEPTDEARRLVAALTTGRDDA